VRYTQRAPWICIPLSTCGTFTADMNMCMRFFLLNHLCWIPDAELNCGRQNHYKRRKGGERRRRRRRRRRREGRIVLFNKLSVVDSGCSRMWYCGAGTMVRDVSKEPLPTKQRHISESSTTALRKPHTTTMSTDMIYTASVVDERNIIMKWCLEGKPIPVTICPP